MKKEAANVGKHTITADDVARYIIRIHPLNNLLTPLKLQCVMMLLWAEYFRLNNEELFSLSYVYVRPKGVGFAIQDLESKYVMFPGIPLSSVTYRCEEAELPTSETEFINTVFPALRELNAIETLCRLHSAGGIWNATSNEIITNKRWKLDVRALKIDILSNPERSFI